MEHYINERPIEYNRILRHQFAPAVAATIRRDTLMPNFATNMCDPICDTIVAHELATDI